MSIQAGAQFIDGDNVLTVVNVTGSFALVGDGRERRVIPVADLTGLPVATGPAKPCAAQYCFRDRQPGSIHCAEHTTELGGPDDQSPQARRARHWKTKHSFNRTILARKLKAAQPPSFVREIADWELPGT